MAEAGRALAAAVLAGLVAAVAVAERPLATVDGRPITGDDLVAAFTAQHGGHSAFLSGEEAVRRALDGVIDDVLLLQEAERLELGTHPTVEAVVQETADALAVRRLVRIEIEDPAEPAEEAIRAAYDAFTHVLLNVRQIVVPDHAEAEEIAARLAAGGSFEELARERSQATSARNGGQLPPIPWGSMSAAWDDVAFALEPGEVSDPFWNGEAWEILELVGTFPIEQPPYEDARKPIAAVLLRRNLEARRRTFSNELMAEHDASVSLQPYDLATWRRALEEDPERVVASWDGGELTAAQMAERLDFEALSELTTEQAARRIQEQVRGALNERLGLLEATARSLAEEPEIAAAIDERREEAMLAVLHGELVFREVAVGDDDVRAWYAAHPEETTRAERRRVGQILLGSEEEARSVAARLAAGEPFAELAAELSKDWDSARKGGDLGWVTREDAPPGFGPVFELDEGEISGPLETALGWHVIQVKEIEPARRLAFDEVRQEIYERLLRDARRSEQERWLDLLRDAASIEIDDEAVRAFTAELADP